MCPAFVTKMILLSLLEHEQFTISGKFCLISFICDTKCIKHGYIFLLMDIVSPAPTILIPGISVFLLGTKEN
jgi:hypothetical protein